MRLKRRLARTLATASVLATVSGMLVPGVAQAFHDAPVVVGDFFFAPEHTTVKVGESVTWRFAGNDPHTATAQDGSFDSGVHVRGDWSHTFDQAGTFNYFCKIHPFMTGTVEVLPAQPVNLNATDTIGAALAWSRATFADGGSNVALLARSDLYPDALASGPVQGLRDAPLLLTPSNTLAPAVRSELKRLGVSKVTLLGGTQAVSSGVAAQLRADGYTVDRVAGPDRIATAVQVAARFFPNAQQAILARAFGDAQDPTRGFADALGAGAVGAELGVPVLLSHTRGLSKATADYLRASAIESVIIAGGEQALSANVAADLAGLGIEVNRAEGPTRFETAIALAFNLPVQPDKILLVNGSNPNAWASGFAAASAAQGGGAVVLTDGDRIPATALSALIDLTPGVICGPFVTDAACGLAGVAASSADFATEGSLLAVLEAVEGVQPAFQKGAFDVRQTGDPRALCYSYEAITVEPPTAAHIHRVSDRAAVVPLSVEPTLFGTVYGCETGLDPALVADILANPKSYFMNVHTETHPAGVISGVLFDPSFFDVAFVSGDQEPAGGDPSAFAFSGLFGDEDAADRICYFIFAEMEETPTAAHIHDAETNQPVVPLEVWGEGEPPVVFECADGLDPVLVADLAANPSDYYVNVHSATFPAGAMRGTLFPMHSEEGQAQAQAFHDAESSEGEAGVSSSWLR